MPGHSTEAWGIIPARGGSKSIPYKNLIELGGIPLIDYVARAGEASTALSRLICSTEDARIGGHAQELGLQVDSRPRELAQDDTPVVEVVCDLLRRAEQRNEALPEIVVLLQPTSPFVMPEHIDRLIEAIRAYPQAASGQTITSCPHNSHAVNQRLFEDGKVTFVFQAERQVAYNKQRKAPHYLFGNLVAARTSTLFETRSLFAAPSVGVPIPRIFSFDVDDADDLAVAGALVSAGLVKFPWQKTKKRGGH
jgi:CMP-N,N'-diacetyllegionaminic acid synthase